MVVLGLRNSEEVLNSIYKLSLHKNIKQKQIIQKRKESRITEIFGFMKAKYKIFVTEFRILILDFQDKNCELTLYIFETILIYYVK